MSNNFNKQNIQFQYDNSASHHRTTYTFSSLQYFFTSSEWIDYEIGNFYSFSLQFILSKLQQNKIQLNHLLGLFSYLFQGNQQNQSYPNCYKTLNIKNIQQILDNDGLRIIMSHFKLILNQLQNLDNITIYDQMIFKVLINLIYTFIFYIEDQYYLESIQKKQTNSKGSPYLNQFYKDIQIDEFLIRLLTLSLQAYFIPIKKVTFLYTKVLANLFSFQQQSDNHLNHININPITIFYDKNIQSLPKQNTIQQNYLEKFKEKHPPPNQINRNQKIQPIQLFYRKHNMGDCPLAQSIVVGLLRSLLTICNSQNHKKFNTVKGSGVDSFRQWQLSYRYAIENEQLMKSACSQKIIERVIQYIQFDKTVNEKSQPLKSSLIFHEFYMHKIYTTSVITNFFMIILLGLKKNVFIQYLYFLQLISDANGILVFLKFLTDKFQCLDDINDRQLLFKYSNSCYQSTEMKFKDKVMLTVYAILNMLYSSCNNYPEKIKNYLFQYNSYLIIKKIPILFFPSLKNKKLERKNSQIQTKRKDQLQGSLINLPSKQDLEELLENKKSESNQQETPFLIRQLTETCYDLLKIQIPYFSKKMKDTNNMKMLVDIYCRFPKTVNPINRSTLQKLILKTRNKKLSHGVNHNKMITTIDDMKNMHNQYNNLYYWSNDFVQIKVEGKTINNKDKSDQINTNNQLIKELDSNFDYDAWLEENIWKYYD